MAQRRVGGGHFQSFDAGATYAPEAVDRLVDAPAGCMKVLNTARDRGRVDRFRRANPHGKVVYRRVAGDDVGTFLQRCHDTVRDCDELKFSGWQDDLYAELPMNEALQGESELTLHAELTIQGCAIYAAAGLRPVGFNFSVGNPIRLTGAHFATPTRRLGQPLHPPGVPVVKLAHPALVRRLGGVIDDDHCDWRFLLDACRALLDAGGAIGLHEYGLPEATADGWLELRYRRVLDYLARQGITGLDVVIGEWGWDHGIRNGQLGGWRVFNLPVPTVAGAWRHVMAEYARDPRVLGVACFGAGAYAGQPPRGWESFEFSDEPALVEAVTGLYDVDDPEEPQEPPVSEQKVVVVAMHRQGDDLRGAWRTPQGYVASLARAGATVCVPDIYQGTRIQGTFSQTPMDFQTLTDLRVFASLAWENGVRTWPMVNPFGADPEGEAELHVAGADVVARAIGQTTYLCVDLEAWYEGFFGVEYGSGRELFPFSELVPRIRRYGAAVMAAAGRTGGRVRVLYVPDPRQIGREYPLDALPSVPLWIQAYWKMFRQDPIDCWSTYVEVGHGGRPVAPIFEGDAATRDIARALEYGRSRWPYVVCWGWGALADADLDLLKSVAGDFAWPEAAPDVPVVDPNNALVVLRDRAWALAGELEDVGGQVGAHGGSTETMWYAGGVMAAATSIKALSVLDKSVAASRRGLMVVDRPFTRPRSKALAPARRRKKGIA